MSEQEMLRAVVESSLNMDNGEYVIIQRSTAIAVSDALDVLIARREVLERALRQCERALRMPWLNTYEESAQALALIDRALRGEEAQHE